MLSQEITQKYQNKALEALSRMKNDSIEESKKGKSVPPVYDRYIFEVGPRAMHYENCGMTVDNIINKVI